MASSWPNEGASKLKIRKKFHQVCERFKASELISDIRPLAKLYKINFEGVIFT